MTTFPIHTLASAPTESRPVLQQLQQTFGFVPNIAGAMATSPVLIRSFIGVFSQAHAGTFSEAEIQVVLLTNAVTNRCTWAVAFHSFLALQQGIADAEVQAIRIGRLPANTQHAALSALARSLIETRGHIDAETMAAFNAAGYSPAQALELINIVAASTITNYVGSVTTPPLEPQFQAHAWQA